MKDVWLLFKRDWKKLTYEAYSRQEFFLEESISVDNNSELTKTFLEALDLHDETLTQNILYYSKAT